MDSGDHLSRITADNKLDSDYRLCCGSIHPATCQKSPSIRGNLKNLTGRSYREEKAVLIGRYEVFSKDEEDRRPQISSNFVFLDGPSKISISENGKVEIQAENTKRLHELKLITKIALRRASMWNPFYLEKIDEINLQTGQKVPLEFYMEVSSVSFTIDQNELQDVVNDLRSTAFESLLFLSRSSDLLSEYSEIPVLMAFLALELELSRVVPDGKSDELSEISRKLAVLEYLHVLPEESGTKLRNMNRLRNALAHGDWQGKKIGDTLNDLLGGGPSVWVTSSGRMNRQAAAEVINQVICALGFLSRCRTPIKDASSQTSSEHACRS